MFGTPEVTEQICQSIRARCPERTAALCAGISEPTYWRWKNDGQKDDAKPEFREFRESIDRALAEAKRGCILEIVGAAQGSEELIWVRGKPEKKKDQGVTETKNPEGLVLERRKVTGGDWRAASWLLSHHPAYKLQWADVSHHEDEGVKGGEPLFVRFVGGPWDHSKKPG